MFWPSRLFEPCHKKTCLMPFTNNKSADQTACISTFVVCCLDIIIPILAKAKISRLQLVAVTDRDDLSLTWP